MLAQKQPQAVNVTVLAAKVAWRVTINILCIDVHFFLDKCFDDVKVSSNARNMKWGSQVFGSAVKVAAKFRKNLDQLNVTFVGCHMHWGPTIAVTFVK